MTLIVFAIHTLCVFVVCASALQRAEMCDLPSVYMGGFELKSVSSSLGWCHREIGREIERKRETVWD